MSLECVHTDLQSDSTVYKQIRPFKQCVVCQGCVKIESGTGQTTPEVALPRPQCPTGGTMFFKRLNCKWAIEIKSTQLVLVVCFSYRCLHVQ